MTESKKPTNNKKEKAFKENISLVLISVMAYTYKK